jgi:cytochrome P450
LGTQEKYIIETCRHRINEKKVIEKSKNVADFDILSIAVRSGVFTDHELVDQMMTFLAAGHGTSTSSLTWAIYMLCIYPEVQKRVREEVRTSLPSLDSDIPFTAADVDPLSYLQAFINECLRLYAPIPLHPREAARDTSIMGQPIPKETSVVIGAWAISRSEELLGPDAQNFNPERWLAPDMMRNGGSGSNYAHMTFGHGPRSCIGQSFARAELACCVAALVGRFEMKIADVNMKLEFAGDIIVRLKRLPVRMTIIEGW